MSTIIYVVAQKSLQHDDFEKVSLYNDLVQYGYAIPEKLRAELETILGPSTALDDGITIRMPEESIVELALDGEGEVMYGDGQKILLSDLPKNTVAIRIYATS